jgi:hypothetical protein
MAKGLPELESEKTSAYPVLRKPAAIPLMAM